VFGIGDSFSETAGWLSSRSLCSESFLFVSFSLSTSTSLSIKSVGDSLSFAFRIILDAFPNLFWISVLAEHGTQ
jgi:hypothetical protein